MSIVYVGIDLAKNVIAVHGVDEAGKAALVRPAVSRQAARDGRMRFISERSCLTDGEALVV